MGFPENWNQDPGVAATPPSFGGGASQQLGQPVPTQRNIPTLRNMKSPAAQGPPDGKSRIIWQGIVGAGVAAVVAAVIAAYLMGLTKSSPASPSASAGARPSSVAAATAAASVAPVSPPTAMPTTESGAASSTASAAIASTIPSAQPPPSKAKASPRSVPAGRSPKPTEPSGPGPVSTTLRF